MKNDVLSTLREYSMVTPGDQILIAVSGGADSVALAHLLCSLRQELDITLSACHVNHLLRGEESERDERFVRDFCESLSVPLSVYREDVAAGARVAGESTEAYGRIIRYACLQKAAGDGKIATAHTRSDQAETSFINLLRGTGLAGLCSIPPVSGRVIRPLIGCTREQVEAYCKENGLAYVTDSSNFSKRYLRNRVRMEIIPALRELQPAFYENFSRMQKHLEKDEDFLEKSAQTAYEEAKIPGGLDIQRIGVCHPAVRFRVLRQFLMESGISYDSVRMELLEKLLEKNSGRIQVDAETDLSAYRGVLSVQKRHGPFVMHKIPVTPDFFLRSPLFTGWVRRYNYEQFTNLQKQDGNILKNTIDYDKIYGKLFLRQKSEGDYFRPVLKKVGKPLRRWFQQEGIAPDKRDWVPVLADEAGPVWVRGFGTDRRAAADENTKCFLVVQPEEDIQVER